MDRSRITIVGLMLLSAVIHSGCARLFPHRSAAAKHDGLFVVTAETTPFYRYGPQQGRGPDRELNKDTMVKLIRHAFGYSKVRLPDGQQGFVANDDLRPP